MKNWRLWIAVFLCFGICVLTGCGETANTTTEQPSKEAEEAEVTPTPEPTPVPTPTPEPTVIIGEKEFKQSVSEADVSYVILNPEELEQVLQSLPKLTELKFYAEDLSAEEIHALKEKYPQVAFSYEFSFREETCGNNTEEINLVGLTSEEVEQTAVQLGKFDSPVMLRLADENGESLLSLEDVAILHEAAPDAAIDYNTVLFKKNVSLLDEELSYTDVFIGEKGAEKIKAILPLMKNCTKVLLDECDISNETMAQIRDDNPDKKVVWRVHFAWGNCLTDATTLRVVGSMTAGAAEPLKYCTEVKFIDFGHSTELTTIEFARYMPHLRILIVVDSAITSLEPLTNCRELQLLEIVNCYALTDLSPLAECENLQFLNMSNCFGVRDITPLYGLEHLERLYCSQYKVPQEQIDEIRELMPDCWITFGRPGSSRVSYNYSIGWRLDAAPNERSEWYIELREIFGVSQEWYSSGRHSDNPPEVELKIFA